MDLELNLVESCVKATDRDIFSSHIVEIVFMHHCTHGEGLCFWLHKFLEFLMIILVQEIAWKVQVLLCASMCVMWDIY